MTELSSNERLLLEHLRDAKQARDAELASGGVAVARPEKYSFPIGIDDRGEPFDVPPAKG